jgi:hypothetical protein
MAIGMVDSPTDLVTILPMQGPCRPLFSQEVLWEVLWGESVV